MKYLVNFITLLRILGSLILIFIPIFSFEFYIIFSLSGLSDMFDGLIARKTHSETKFGEIFDTIADIIFFVISSILILMAFKLSIYLWVWITAIFILKSGSVIFGYIFLKKFYMPHTILNKITGFLLFLMVFVIKYIGIEYPILIVCIVATVASIEELVKLIGEIKSREKYILS